MTNSKKAFIDSNVFIYLYSGTEKIKQQIAQEYVDVCDCVISTQVLNEFSNVCIRKFNKSVDEIKLAIEEIIDECTVLFIEIEDVSQALDFHKKYGYRFWDCLMLVSALKLDCTYIFTEDMQDGQIIENKLTIKNIFNTI